MPDPLPTSPSTSSFVPLSMLDSVRPPTRTLPRPAPATTGSTPHPAPIQLRAPRPSSAPQHSFGAAATAASRDKAEAAKREARAVMDALGMAGEVERDLEPESAGRRGADEGGGGEGAEVARLEGEVARLKLALREQGGELSRARSELLGQSTQTQRVEGAEGEGSVMDAKGLDRPRALLHGPALTVHTNFLYLASQSQSKARPSSRSGASASKGTRPGRSPALPRRATVAAA